MAYLQLRICLGSPRVESQVWTLWRERFAKSLFFLFLCVMSFMASEEMMAVPAGFIAMSRSLSRFYSRVTCDWLTEGDGFCKLRAETFLVDSGSSLRGLAIYLCTPSGVSKISSCRYPLT